MYTEKLCHQTVQRKAASLADHGPMMISIHGHLNKWLVRFSSDSVGSGCLGLAVIDGPLLRQVELPDRRSCADTSQISYSK
jgi:hypothetical protein